jgi:hypothetical protein
MVYTQARILVMHTPLQNTISRIATAILISPSRWRNAAFLPLKRGPPPRYFSTNATFHLHFCFLMAAQLSPLCELKNIAAKREESLNCSLFMSFFREGALLGTQEVIYYAWVCF